MATWAFTKAATHLLGTPVQNNMREVFGLMNLLDPEQHGDEEEFGKRFGGGGTMPTTEQVLELQVRTLLSKQSK